tara:strand:+ start:255 stop:497 length:243 start_codon:yes stop_codon:yes gene_type:complete
MICHFREKQMSDVPNLNDIVLKDRSYFNFYEAFIECDFCGQQTRGRVYNGSDNVICGACDAVLLTLTEVEQYPMTGTFPR